MLAQALQGVAGIELLQKRANDAAPHLDELLDLRNRLAELPEATLEDELSLSIVIVLRGNCTELTGDQDTALAMYRDAMLRQEAALARLGGLDGGAGVAFATRDLLSKLAYSYERVAVAVASRGNATEAVALRRKRIGVAEQLIALDPGDRYARIGLAEARRHFNASFEYPDAVAERGPIIRANLEHCRSLAHDEPACRRSQQELVHALVDAARLDMVLGELTAATDLASEAALAAAQRRRMEPELDEFVDLAAYVAGAQMEIALARGDNASAKGHLLDCRAAILVLVDRYPTSERYRRSLSSLDARLASLQSEAG